jgi:hypothetical protein
MKSKQSEIVELESELLRLNSLVRARRAQLDRLEKCPHKDCECRTVWHDVVENKLVKQMRKIGGHVANGNSKPGLRKAAKAKRASAKA